MSLVDTAAVLVTCAAILAFVNHRFVGLPSAIGLMAIAMALSLGLLGLGALGFVGIEDAARRFVASIDFGAALMHGMLSFLLFAGALHVDLGELAERKWTVATLATGGTVLSAAIVAAGFWLLARALGLEIAFAYCLVFGALISPTDPIAVLGILKSAGAPRPLEVKITGESLFNDGLGVVLFVVLLGIATGEAAPSASGVAGLLVEEALGGVAFGLALGGLAYWMLRRVDAYSVEVLVTLAVVMGGYSAASALHVSGPIAMVVAGLLIGNHGRRLAMSATTREHLDTFWELVDEVLNAVLFVLIGLEVLILPFSGSVLAAGLAAIVLVLAARAAAVAVPLAALARLRAPSPGAFPILTWGGLRGGISIALALSLPAGPERDLVLPVTYAVVAFSIIVQGLTLGPVVRRAARAAGRS